MAFRTFEEISREEADRPVREEGAKYVSSRWEDQTRGNEVRSRWVLRQFATQSGNESFYYSPVPGQFDLQVACCYASLMKFPMHFLDVSTALMHSPSDEILITEAPMGFQKPNTVWRLRRQIDGSRAGSSAWSEWLGTQLRHLGWRRSTLSPSTYVFDGSQAMLTSMTSW
jgi:hypothetical protein